MKIEFECISCLLQTTLKTQRLINPEEWPKVSPQILKAMGNTIEEKGLIIPGHISSPILRMLQNERPGFDPYKDVKMASNKLAEGLIEGLLEERDDLTLKELCLYAAASNIIDFAIIDSLDECKEMIEKVINQGFKVDDFDKLAQNLEDKKTLLFFPDNSGEIMYDKLLLQHIKANYDIKIKVCIHTDYILNDATKDEIIGLGFMEFTDEIVDLYPALLGIDLDNEHSYLKEVFTKDSLVIAKGLANYESFDEYNIDNPVFSIFLAKCLPIARRESVSINSAVLKQFN